MHTPPFWVAMYDNYHIYFSSNISTFHYKSISHAGRPSFLRDVIPCTIRVLPIGEDKIAVGMGSIPRGTKSLPAIFWAENNSLMNAIYDSYRATFALIKNNAYSLNMINKIRIGQGVKINQVNLVDERTFFKFIVEHSYHL